MDEQAPPCTTSDCKRGLARELNNELSAVLMPVTVFVGVEGLLGLVGNILVLYIYIFRYHVCNFKFVVVGLALNDLLSCLTTIPGEMVTQLYWYVYPVPLVCKIKSFFNVFTVSASALILLLMAFDRFLKICRPFGWQIRHNFTIILSVVSFAIAFIIAFPVVFLWGTRSYTRLYNGTNITVTLCEKDQRFEATDKPLAYSISLQTIIILVMLIMVLLYAAIARKMFRDTSRGSSEAGAADSHSRSSAEISEQEETPICTDIPLYQSADHNDVSNDVRSSPGSTASRQQAFLRPDPGGSRNNNVAVGKRKSLIHRAGVRRRTLIMFLLTAVFIVTTILYLSLLSNIARADDILDSMTDVQKTIYFFFFRMFFINHVINPVLYGILDPECRNVTKDICRDIATCCHKGRR